jgi:integrase
MSRATTGGMIRQHPARGLWEARYTAADGKRLSLYAKTQREAQERLRKALTDVDNGLPALTHRLTLDAWLDEWLATSVAARCRPSTARSYRDVAARYIRPALGRRLLAKLTPEDVQRMLADLSARGDLSPTTVRYAHAVLRIALGRAMKSGRVSRNVAALVDPPSGAAFELRPLAAEQIAAFRAAISGHRLEPLFLAALGTGLRQGELLALRWADVDLDAGTLTVRASLDPLSMELGEPKTDKARRTLHLPLPVRVALTRLQAEQASVRSAARRWDARGFVFATRTGGPLGSRNVTTEFQRVLARAGLPRQRFHDLRHAFATLQLEAGAQLFEVSRALGHASITTTANTYAHFTDSMAERTADRMAAILGAG